MVFDIPEKKTKVGVQICYDLNFPEISRNETLMGAEVLVKLTMDPQELYKLNEHYHYVRALENPIGKRAPENMDVDTCQKNLDDFLASKK